MRAFFADSGEGGGAERAGPRLGGADEEAGLRRERVSGPRSHFEPRRVAVGRRKARSEGKARGGSGMRSYFENRRGRRERDEEAEGEVCTYAPRPCEPSHAGSGSEAMGGKPTALKVVRNDGSGSAGTATHPPADFTECRTSVHPNTTRKQGKPENDPKRSRETTRNDEEFLNGKNSKTDVGRKIAVRRDPCCRARRLSLHRRKKVSARRQRTNPKTGTNIRQRIPPCQEKRRKFLKKMKGRVLFMKNTPTVRSGCRRFMCCGG